MYRTLVFVVYAMCLMGCVNKLKVTYSSEPSGAQIFEGSRYWGLAPITLEYDISPAFKNGGCMSLSGLKARWASGTETSYSSINACASIGYNQALTFKRPNDVPGIGTDKQQAAQHEYQRALQAEAEAESNRLLAESIGNLIGTTAGAAIEGRSSAPSSSSSSYYAPPSSNSSEKQCDSDYSCGTGYTCVKAPFKSSGVCMKSVNDYGTPVYNTPRSDSIGIKGEGQCMFNTDCPIGFKCDQTYKACVK